MDLAKWVAKTFGRFVGLTLALYGYWILLVNATGAIGTFGQAQYHPWWILPIVLFAGAAAAAGGTLFLLSLNGPSRFRTKRIRSWAVVLMLTGGLLPTSLTVFVVPLTLLILPSLFFLFRENQQKTRSLHLRDVPWGGAWAKLGLVAQGVK